MTTHPEDDLPGAHGSPRRSLGLHPPQGAARPRGGPSGAALTSAGANAMAAAVALAGGFAAVVLSWQLAGALVGFAAFLVWNARRDVIERLAEAETPAPWYVGAHRELELAGTAAHQAELKRLVAQRGRAWVSGMLRPVATGPSFGAVTLDVDGAVLGALSPGSVARYRSRHGDTPTAVAFAIVQRDGHLAIVFV